MSLLRAPARAAATSARRARPAAAVLGARPRPLRAAVSASSCPSTPGRLATTTTAPVRRARPSAALAPARARRSVRVSAVAMSPISDGVDDGRIPVTVRLFERADEHE
jgi:hypothetical protein